MNLVDTNFLARLLLCDDPVQSPLAAQFLKKRKADYGELVILDLVFGELIWLLHKSRKLSRSDVLALGMALLGDERFHFENLQRLADAISLFGESNADFTDTYLTACASEYTQTKVLSFDTDFKHLPVEWEQP